MITYRDKQYSIERLSSIARLGVALTIETSKINILNKDAGTKDALVVVANGDNYDLLCGIVDPEAKTQNVRLLSKPVLKKAQADVVYAETTQESPYKRFPVNGNDYGYRRNNYRRHDY